MSRSPLVLKYGGSSLARTDQIRRIAARLAALQRDGRRLLVVVSARGRQTDRLRQLAGVLASRPPARELDLLLSSGELVSAALLSMAVSEAGGNARALTAAQTGILTDEAFGQATVRAVATDGLVRLLDAGLLPVVAGFQGTTPGGDVTTLGRGGSDTTAVALAAALGWPCEICSDVCGLMSADPAIVPRPILREQVRYDEMLELSRLGARLLHWQAAAIAQQRRVPVTLRHSRRKGGGTELVEHTDDMPAVTAIAATRLEGPQPVGLLSVVGAGAAGGAVRRILASFLGDVGLDSAPLDIADRRLTCRVPAGRVEPLLAALHERLLKEGALQSARPRQQMSGA